MNHVGKETAENFLWDRRTRSSADAAIRWSKRIWCTCRRISPAGAEEAWRRGVCGETTGEEILPSKTLFARKRQRAFCLAEQVGFEPTAPFGVTGFQDQLLKPLGHLSMKFSCFFLRSDLDYYILPTNGCQAIFSLSFVFSF